MAFDSTVLSAVDSGYASSAFWRVVVILAVLLVALVVWRLARRRWATRTIANWSGKGVHTGLTPLEAALLVRCHPTLLVAIALEPRLLDGKARIRRLRPLSIHWPTRDPVGPVDEALSRCVTEDGRIAESGVHALLDVLYAETNAKMVPYAGRETVIHYRDHVKRLWDHVLGEGAVADEDRPWLMLHDPARVAGRIRPGRAENALHDLIRLGGVFRTNLLAAERIAELARGARSGYFSQRPDLATMPDGDDEPPDVPERALPPGPLEKKLQDLAEVLDGEVTGVEPEHPYLLTYSTQSPIVSGRYLGRTAIVDPGARTEEVEIQLASSVGRRFQFVPNPEPPGIVPISSDLLRSGDPEFDGSFTVRHVDCPELESWLAMPGFLESIRALTPFSEIMGRERVLGLRHAFDRDTFTAAEIHEKFSPLLLLAENLEQRLTMAARPTSGFPEKGRRGWPKLIDEE